MEKTEVKESLFIRVIVFFLLNLIVLLWNLYIKQTIKALMQKYTSALYRNDFYTLTEQLSEISLTLLLCSIFCAAIFITELLIFRKMVIFMPQSGAFFLILTSGTTLAFSIINVLFLISRHIEYNAAYSLIEEYILLHL